MNSSISALHYIGNAFRDLLYNYESQNREHAAAWKLARSMPHMTALSSDWWSWIAIGIPLNLVDKNQPQGDIDLLIARPDPEHIRHGKAGPTPQQYRSFELKVGTLNNKGEVKSLKKSKFKKTVMQLTKLADFGAEQIFFLDTYVTQAGFSNSYLPLPSTMSEAVLERRDKLNGNRFGYVVQLIEQIEGYDEEKSGIVHLPVNLLPAHRVVAGVPFINLIHHIENYLKNEHVGNQQLVTIIGYCYNCKALASPQSYEAPMCNRCGRDLIKH